MLSDSLKIDLANSFVFYLKALKFHWNTSGRTFYQNHKLFQKIYELIYQNIDKQGELIASLGSYALASIDSFYMLKELDDSMEVTNFDDMLNELLSDNLHIIANLLSLRQLAESESEFHISAFIDTRLEVHKKIEWFLRNSLKNDQ